MLVDVLRLEEVGSNWAEASPGGTKRCLDENYRKGRLRLYLKGPTIRGGFGILFDLE